MSGWILSIVGVICLGVLLEIVLPEGQTSKYVKGAFSLLVIFVIVAPIPAFLQKEWNIDADGISYEIDDAFVSETAAIQTESVERELEDYLLLNGYTAEVSITLSEGSVNEIEKVDIAVTLGEAQKDDMEKHAAAVKTLAAGRLNESEDIIFVEIEIGNGGDEYGCD